MFKLSQNKVMSNQQAWNYALGIIKVDGLTPSPDFLELIEKEIKGEISTDDIRDI
ncbi:MAG: antitoxin VbhA family protein [Methanocorpusculum sp.]|nr:antitoxin VbhA family protein [Methanocorpusculum sp.]